MIELRHLRYFIAVAETQNFGRAAAQLHISQPPLSRAIQQLEAHLGTRLFLRVGRGVQLSAAGSQFLHDARRMLVELQRAERNAVRTARGETGTVRIGFVSTALYSVLPGLVRQLRQRLPGVELVLEEQTVGDQQRALQAAGIDLGLALCPQALPGLDQRVVQRETLVACLAIDHPLARQPPAALALEALREEAFVMFPRERSPGLFDHILSMADAAGFSLKCGQQAVQMQTIVGLVSAGLGPALVPASIATLQRPGVVYRSLTDAGKPVETALIWRRQDDNPALTRVLSELSADDAWVGPASQA